MRQLVIFLEERSAEAMLQGLLPRILPEGVSHRCVPFEGKQDLDKQIERRLRGWIQPATVFLILRDQDASDCKVLKKALRQKIESAGHPETIIRIACRELESWYFGDLEAVEEALGIPKLQKHAGKKQYRIPDAIVSPSKELEKITSGYYQKTSGSRAIGNFLVPGRNTSHSFQVFLQGIQKALSSLSS